MQIETGEIDAHGLHVHVDLPQRMGAVEQHVDAVFARQRHNFLERQLLAIGRRHLRQQQQPGLDGLAHGLRVTGDDLVIADGQAQFDLRAGDATALRQPAHGRAHGRIIEITP
ncbi:hypothetical protein D3C81_1570580 [compost metagenome]